MAKRTFLVVPAAVPAVMRHCVVCDVVLFGRTDQVVCSERCRARRRRGTPRASWRPAAYGRPPPPPAGCGAG